MYRSNEQWHLLFIRRAVHPADRHSGEVAFPGGRVDARDADAQATALREAWEEIGLACKAVHTLGQLPAFRTASNYLVHPVVGRIDWPLRLQADTREVARIFSIPLDWLASRDNHQEQDWRPPGCESNRRVVVFREYDGERLWGVSARITLSLLDVLL